MHNGHIPLTLAVHNDLVKWRWLIAALCCHPNHMLKVSPPDPTTLSAHDAWGNGMDGVFWGPNGIPFVWHYIFLADIAARLVSWDNLEGDCDINKFKLARNYAQAALVSPRMTPLFASAFICNNFTTISWVKRGSILHKYPAAAFLHAQSFFLW